MDAYSKKYKASKIWVLYPFNSEMYNHFPIQFDSDDGTTIKSYFIDMKNMENNLTVLRNKLT
jgi:5-methylcytosine-specific restriction enzyme subunit McrC